MILKYVSIWNFRIFTPKRFVKKCGVGKKKTREAVGSSISPPKVSNDHFHPNSPGGNKIKWIVYTLPERSTVN